MQPFPLNVIFVFFVVTIGALIAMVLGGAFGYAAGLIGPDIFANLLPWEKFKPVGVATVVGAFGGVLCGGALAAFAVLVQFVVSLRARRDRNDLDAVVHKGPWSRLLRTDANLSKGRPQGRADGLVERRDRFGVEINELDPHGVLPAADIAHPNDL